MTAPRDPYEPFNGGETGMAQLHALQMAEKLSEYSRQREAKLIRTLWRLIKALVVIIFLLVVFA